jgi:mannose/fructose/N-acetylgalactosamine-specific phosphotransferase system component IIC
MAIAALVLGIVSIVFLFIFQPVSLIAGIVGTILAILARKQAKSGQATAGLVLSIIGAVLGLIFTLVCMVCIAAGTKALQERGSSWQQIIDEAKKSSGDVNKAAEEARKAAGQK